METSGPSGSIKIPSGLSNQVYNWSLHDVATFLREYKMGCGLDEADIETIKNNGIAGISLSSLTFDDLRALGLSLGPARGIEILIKRLINTSFPTALLTEVEFFARIPPSLHYIDTPKEESKEDLKDSPPGLSSKPKYDKYTKSRYAKKLPNNKVHEWRGFKEEVMGMSLNGQDRKYSEPSFEKFEYVCSEAGVQRAFEQNVLRQLYGFIKHNHAYEGFNDAEAFTEMKGKPDFIFWRIGKPTTLLAAIEMKTQWILTGALDLVVEYNTSPKAISIQRSIEQIYGYTHLNKLRYGVLSTYDVTWFLKVSDELDLYISSPIKYNDTEPSLLQSLAYLTSIARDSPFRGPPPPPPSPPENSPTEDSTRKRNQGGPSGNTRGQQKKSERDGDNRKRRKQGTADGRQYSAGIPKTIETRQLNVEEFQCMNSLGRGRSGTVFRAYWRGEEVALKLCDIAQQPDYEQELMTEVEVYNSLKKLQGRYIPRLVTAGYDGHLFFAIATEIVGSPIKVDQLSLSERWEIVEALSRIHCSGFLHNDIREENILVQRSKAGFKASFIDFAFSSRASDKKLFSDEMNCLKTLLGLDKAAEMPSQNQLPRHRTTRHNKR